MCRRGIRVRTFRRFLLMALLLGMAFQALGEHILSRRADGSGSLRAFARTGMNPEVSDALLLGVRGHLLLNLPFGNPGS